jgi:hypothetical protein
MRTPDLPGAVERLRTELDARSFAPADVVPVLSYMTVGDLRTILEALSAPYVPGMQPVDHSEYVDRIWEDRSSAILTVYTRSERVSALGEKTSYFIEAAAVTE